MNKISIIFTLVLSILFITGCGSKKTVSTGGDLEKKAHTKVISDALTSELQYETISTKGSIEFKIGSSSKKSSATFKIEKDKVMQVSVRPMLGMEAFRITFTPDSVIILDRLKKQYLVENIKDSKLMKDFDFNYYNLQALLTNQLFVPGKQNVTEPDYDKFNISSSKDVYLLQTKDKGDLSYNFAVDASNRIISTLIYNEGKSVTLQWTYNEFIQDEGRLYPTNMNAKIDIAKKRLDVGIEYKKLDINKKLDVDITIPKGYTEVSFTELMATYIKAK
ncbi:MAG: DUF4292 domain-containing protein [Prevotella sp.]|nr:DUF4292 domain-containing protein [Prevotella sp.]